VSRIDPVSALWPDTRYRCETNLLAGRNDGDAALRERIREVRATSLEPFDVWFREQFRTALGIDLTHPAAGARVEEVGGWVAGGTR
jgi:hypothetical protein